MLTSKEEQESEGTTANSPGTDITNVISKVELSLGEKKKHLSLHSRAHVSYPKFLPHSPSISASCLVLRFQPACTFNYG